ncbi:cysteine-rich receptor-like protein kinase 6 [Miscanthus floridulus]|uniref:cysteine-rich receptor-like protein kinase 6 n=1 Tax=Miscanthus floridulus TaxID=154761 RepID=UPI003459FFDF
MEPSDGKARWVARPFSYICNPTYDYYNSMRSSSTFQANHTNLSYELPGNVKASGFASRAFGDTPYTAYGLVLCRGDFLGDHNATMYYDQCMFRFFDRDFLSSYDNSANQMITWNMNNLSGRNVDAFVSQLGRLVNMVAIVASRYGTAMAC